MLLGALQTAVRAIYPPRCLGCGGLVESDHGLCGPCWRNTAFIGDTACDLCGAPLPGEAGAEALHCDDCLRIARPWERGRAALVYTGTGRRLVLGLKHGDRLDLVETAAAWMAARAAPLVADRPLVVPVPLHRWRLLARRYNQSALLAEALARRLGLDVLADGLVRPTGTPPLDGKTRDDRFATLSGQIAPNPGQAAQLRGRAVLLVDDVMTSGATFAACTEACHAAGATKVFVLALARVAKDA